MINHQNNFGTNLTAGTTAGDTTSPLNSIPTVDAPFYIAFDATNINSHYEVVLITSKTATNVNHEATSYNHTTAEEVRMVVPATEMDALDTGWKTIPATLTYSSADAPTYVCTTSIDLTSAIGVGSRIKLTHGGSTKYFIVTAIDASTITLYGGTDYTLAAGAITAPYYSKEKSPIGFPLSPVKWTVEIVDSAADTVTNSPSAATWYNDTSISIPIGVWDVSYVALSRAARSTAGAISGLVTLSTANNSESDAHLTSASIGNSTYLYTTTYKNKTLTLAAKTTYYLNYSCGDAGMSLVGISSANSNTVIRAVCAYL